VEAVILYDGPDVVVTKNKINKPFEVIDWTAITSTKLVILTLYIRIFTTKQYKRVTYAVGGLIILTCVAAYILSCTICSPIAFQWDHSIKGGHCMNLIAAYTWFCVPNIVSDLMMLVLPLPALYKLRMDLAAKIGLTATFLMGSVYVFNIDILLMMMLIQERGIIASIARFIGFINSQNALKDPTWSSIPNYSLVIAEAGTYLIASCMPALRPLKHRFFPRHSFTKLIDSTLKILPSKGSYGYSSGSDGNMGITRTSNFEVESRRIDATRSDLEAGNATELQDVGRLVQEPEASWAPPHRYL
jgi:hypothetical protein